MLIVHCFADALTLNYDEQINISLFYQLLMDVVVFQNYQFDKLKKNNLSRFYLLIIIQIGSAN